LAVPFFILKEECKEAAKMQNKQILVERLNYSAAF